MMPGEESIKTSIVLPRPTYELIDRYRRSLGWRSMSAFLAAAAEHAIEQRLENTDTTPTKFDRLGQDGPDEMHSVVFCLSLQANTAVPGQTSLER